MKYRNEIEIDVGRCFRALKNKYRLIIIMSLLFLLIGVACTLGKRENKYSAQATVYSVSSGSYTESKTGISAMNDYVDVATSYKVCQRAAYIIGDKNIDADTVMKSIKVVESESSSKTSSVSYMTNDSAIIIITATCESKKISMKMADAVADAFVLEMSDILGTDSVQVLDKAYTSKIALDGNVQKWKIRILAAVAGCMLTCFMIVFFEIFDRYIRTTREASIRGKLPVIGIIPEYK